MTTSVLYTGPSGLHMGCSDQKRWLVGHQGLVLATISATENEEQRSVEEMAENPNNQDLVTGFPIVGKGRKLVEEAIRVTLRLLASKVDYH